MSSLMGNKQVQEVGDNSCAIQVHGDYKAGLSYRDVKDICVDLIQANFPVLQEEARQISMQYVEEFGVKFFNRLVQEETEHVQERLKNPDVQAAINSSVIHVARMTDKSHQDILCELLAEKIKEQEDEKNIVFNDAIEIMTKISRNQILFLSLIYLLRSLGKQTNNPALQYHYYETQIPSFLGNDFYKIDTFLLGYKGLIRSESMQSYATPLTELLKSRTAIDIPNYATKEDIKDDDTLSTNFPKLTKIIKDFGFNNIKEFDSCPITPIGNEIAKAYLKNIGLLKG